VHRRRTLYLVYDRLVADHRNPSGRRPPILPLPPPPDTDGGPPDAAAAIDNGQADLAVVRRDAGMPKNGQAVAILRKNVVVFIVPSPAEPAKAATGKPAKGKAAAQAKPAVKSKAAKGKAAKGKAASASDDDAEEPDKAGTIDKIDQMVGKRLGVIGRSPRNIELLKVILRQYRISPDQIVMLSSEDLKKPNAAGKISVVQFDPNNVSSAIRDSNVDVIMSVGPVGSPITADAIAAATRGKEAPPSMSARRFDRVGHGPKRTLLSNGMSPASIRRHSDNCYDIARKWARSAIQSAYARVVAVRLTVQH